MQRCVPFLLVAFYFFVFTASVVCAKEAVDLNKATFSQLEKVPGIGPDMAKKIVEQRNKIGSFKNVDDLLQIKGIGPKTIEKIAPYLSIDGKPLGESSPSTKASKAVSGEKININTASRSELEKLPGVGPKTAKLIIEYRKDNGPFKKPSDIKKVKGIGEKTYKKMADMIVVN